MRAYRAPAESGPRPLRGLNPSVSFRPDPDTTLRPRPPARPTGRRTVYLRCTAGSRKITSGRRVFPEGPRDTRTHAHTRTPTPTRVKRSATKCGKSFRRVAAERCFFALLRVPRPKTVRDRLLHSFALHSSPNAENGPGGRGLCFNKKKKTIPVPSPVLILRHGVSTT